ncbi:hypothetical protein [Streptomyces sp. NPDC056600]|uniref:hypothetical protein n=1 Tax=Streptomyces sp. NPDC056600 TaxID=3345874 RepID=UPI0036C14B66
MQILGFTPAEEELYRRLLRRPGLPVAAVVGPAGGTDGAAARDVDRLRALGAVVERDGALWPEHPERVVTRLSGRLLEELHTLIRGLGALRPVVDSLKREAAPGRMPWPRAAPEPALVERITDAALMRATVRSLAHVARTEMLVAGPWSAGGPEARRALARLCTVLLRRSVLVRVVVWRSVPGEAVAVPDLAELHAAGARVRVLPEPDGPLLACDRNRLLVPVDPSDFARGLLSSSAPGLVLPAVRRFELLWDDALDPAEAGD